MCLSRIINQEYIKKVDAEIGYKIYRAYYDSDAYYSLYRVEKTKYCLGKSYTARTYDKIATLDMRSLGYNAYVPYFHIFRDKKDAVNLFTKMRYEVDVDIKIVKIKYWGKIVRGREADLTFPNNKWYFVNVAEHIQLIEEVK